MLTSDSSAVSAQPSVPLVPATAPAAPSTVALLAAAPRVSGLHARLTRLIGQGLQLPLRLPQSKLTLRLAPSEALQPWHKVLLLRGAAGEFHVADGARLLQALTGIDPAALPATEGAYLPWAVAALCGRLNDTPLAGMQKILIQADGSTAPPHTVALSLSLVQQGHAIHTEIRATPAHWLQWLTALQSRRLLLPLAPYLPLIWSAPVLLARHRLPLAAMRQLAAGDIVLPATRYFSTDGSGNIALAGQYWRVRYQAPSQLQLIAQEHSLDTIDTQELPETPQVSESAGEAPAEAAPVTASEAASEKASETPQAEPLQVAADAEPAGAEAAALDQIPVTLHFELGRIGLPLAQVRSLAAHSVLTLQGGAPEAIAITSSGRTLGQGEVVNVDGALAIRITHWGGAC